MASKSRARSKSASGKNPSNRNPKPSPDKHRPSQRGSRRTQVAQSESAATRPVNPCNPCCCIPLLEACIVVGVWTLLYSIVQLCLFGWQTALIQSKRERLASVANPFGSYDRDWPGRYAKFYKSPEVYFYTAIFAIQIVHLVVDFALLCASVAVIWGFHCHVRWLIWPWFLILVGNIIATLAYCVTWWANGNKDTPDALLAVQIIFVVINIYCLIVVMMGFRGLRSGALKGKKYNLTASQATATKYGAGTARQIVIDYGDHTQPYDERFQTAKPDTVYYYDRDGNVISYTNGAYGDSEQNSVGQNLNASAEQETNWQSSGVRGPLDQNMQITTHIDMTPTGGNVLSGQPNPQFRGGAGGELNNLPPDHHNETTFPATASESSSVLRGATPHPHHFNPSDLLAMTSGPQEASEAELANDTNKLIPPEDFIIPKISLSDLDSTAGDAANGATDQFPRAEITFQKQGKDAEKESKKGKSKGAGSRKDDDKSRRKSSSKHRHDHRTTSSGHGEHRSKSARHRSSSGKHRDDHHHHRHHHDRHRRHHHDDHRHGSTKHHRRRGSDRDDDSTRDDRRRHRHHREDRHRSHSRDGKRHRSRRDDDDRGGRRARSSSNKHHSSKSHSRGRSYDGSKPRSRSRSNSDNSDCSLCRYSSLETQEAGPSRPHRAPSVCPSESGTHPFIITRPSSAGDTLGGGIISPPPLSGADSTHTIAIPQHIIIPALPPTGGGATSGDESAASAGSQASRSRNIMINSEIKISMKKPQNKVAGAPPALYTTSIPNPPPPVGNKNL